MAREDVEVLALTIGMVCMRTSLTLSIFVSDCHLIILAQMPRVAIHRPSVGIYLETSFRNGQVGVGRGKGRQSSLTIQAEIEVLRRSPSFPSTEKGLPPLTLCSNEMVSL